MQGCSQTKVEGCLLCHDEQLCCPEHCCDWDTCECADCTMCQKDKKVEEEAIIPQEECLVFDGSAENQLPTTLPLLSQSPEEADPNLKRILHSQVLKQPALPKDGSPSKITNMRLQKAGAGSTTLDYQEEKNFAHTMTQESMPDLEELQTQHFALEAQRKLEKKNPRIYRQKTSASYFEEAKERSFYAQNRPSSGSASFRRSQPAAGFVPGVRGLRSLKISRDFTSAGVPFRPPTTGGIGMVAGPPPPAAFIPTVRPDGSRVFKRKQLVKSTDETVEL